MLSCPGFLAWRWDAAQDIGNAAGIRGVLGVLEKKKLGFLDDRSPVRALERCPPAPVELQTVSVAELSGGPGLKQMLYLCNRELTALHRILQGNGGNVPAVQRGVAAEWGSGTTHTRV